MTMNRSIPSYHERVTITQIHPEHLSSFQVLFESTAIYQAKSLITSPYDDPFLAIFDQYTHVNAVSFSSSESSDMTSSKSFVSPLSVASGLSIQLSATMPEFSFLLSLTSSHLLFPLGVSPRIGLARDVPNQWYMDHQFHASWIYPQQSLTYGLLYSSFQSQTKKMFSFPCSNAVSDKDTMGIFPSLYDSWEPSSSTLEKYLSNRAAYLQVSREQIPFNNHAQDSQIVRIHRSLRYTLDLRDLEMNNITLGSLFHPNKHAQNKHSMIRACPLMDTSELKLQLFGLGSIPKDKSADNDQCDQELYPTLTCPPDVSHEGETTNTLVESTVDLKTNIPIYFNSSLLDILHQNDSSVQRLENNRPLITIERSIQRPRGIWNSGTLWTSVTSQCLTTSGSWNDTCVSRNITLVDDYPNIIRPLWNKLGIYLVRDDFLHNYSQKLDVVGHAPWPHGKSVTRFQLIDFSSNAAQLNMNEDGSSSFSLNMILPPDSTLYISVDYHPRFLPLDAFPADPNRGFEISPSYCIIHDHYHYPLPNFIETRTDNPSYTIYSNTLMIMPPVPDMSMPYNVISLTNSFFVLVIGFMTNILSKKATKQVKDAMKVKTDQKTTIFNRLREKLRKYVR